MTQPVSPDAPVDERVTEATQFARREMPSLRDAVTDRMAAHLTGVLSAALIEAIGRNPDWPMFLELALSIEAKRAQTAAELADLRAALEDIEASAQRDAQAVQNWNDTAETINLLLLGQPELTDNVPLHERLRMYVERVVLERDLAENGLEGGKAAQQQPVAGQFDEGQPNQSAPAAEELTAETRLDVEVPGADEVSDKQAVEWAPDVEVPGAGGGVE